MASLSQTLASGTKIDRYEVVEALGEGGFGSVYIARHTFTDQRVALKVLHPELTTSQDMVERFFREARAAASVGSPHIVRVYDCGVSPQEQPFLAMELLQGRDLSSLLGDDEAVIAPDRALRIIIQTLDGLAAAHGVGVVHRDLKPANIFLNIDLDNGDELVKILDFGVSKVQLEALDAALTRTGMWLGTPKYMAPEQFNDPRTVDHRADLYSVAVVLFEMLSGRLPIEATSPMEAAYRATHEDVPSLGELVHHLPEELVQIVDRGLARDSDERWLDAASFAEALRHASDSGSTGFAPSWVPREPGQSKEPRRGSATPVPTRPGPGSFPSGSEPLNAPVQLEGLQQGISFSGPTGLSASIASSAITSGGAHPSQLHPQLQPTDRRWGLLAALFITAGILGGAIAVLIVLVVTGVFGASNDDPQPRVSEGVSVVTPMPLPAAPSAPAWGGQSPYGTPPPAVPSYGQPTPLPPAAGWGVPSATPVNPQPVVPVSPQPSVPVNPQPVTPTLPPVGNATIEVTDVRIVGQIDSFAVDGLVERALPRMERCRLAGQTVNIQAQAHIHTDPGRITLARDGPQNSGPVGAARCCANVLRGSVPAGWNPGSSGIVFFEITLVGR